MKKLLLSTLLLCGASALHGTTPMPAALTGYKWDTRELNTTILFPARIATVVSPKWIEPADYTKYSAVYIGERLRGLGSDANWNSDEKLDLVLNYLHNGGTIIVSGNTPAELVDAKKFPAQFTAIFGFKTLSAVTKPKGLKIKGNPSLFPLAIKKAAAAPADNRYTSWPLDYPTTSDDNIEILPNCSNIELVFGTYHMHIRDGKKFLYLNH